MPNDQRQRAQGQNVLLRIFDGVLLAGAWLAAIGLCLIVAAYTYEVVARYLFNAPTWWSAELVAYLLCIMTFSMMPYVTATRAHVAVTILLDLLSARNKVWGERAIWFAGFLVCAAMAWFAGGETLRQFTRNIQMMATHPIPKWWVSSWIVIGFALSSLAFLRLALVGPMATKPDGDKTEVEAV